MYSTNSTVEGLVDHEDTASGTNVHTDDDDSSSEMRAHKMPRFDENTLISDGDTIVALESGNHPVSPSISAVPSQASPSGHIETVRDFAKQQVQELQNQSQKLFESVGLFCDRSIIVNGIDSLTAQLANCDAFPSDEFRTQLTSELMCVFQRFKEATNLNYQDPSHPANEALASIPRTYTFVCDSLRAASEELAKHRQTMSEAIKLYNASIAGMRKACEILPRTVDMLRGMNGTLKMIITHRDAAPSAATAATEPSGAAATPAAQMSPTSLFASALVAASPMELNPAAVPLSTSATSPLLNSLSSASPALQPSNSFANIDRVPAAVDPQKTPSQYVNEVLLRCIESSPQSNNNNLMKMGAYIRKFLHMLDPRNNSCVETEPLPNGVSSVNVNHHVNLGAPSPSPAAESYLSPLSFLTLTSDGTSIPSNNFATAGDHMRTSATFEAQSRPSQQFNQALTPYVEGSTELNNELRNIVDEELARLEASITIEPCHENDEGDDWNGAAQTDATVPSSDDTSSIAIGRSRRKNKATIALDDVTAPSPTPFSPLSLRLLPLSTPAPLTSAPVASAIDLSSLPANTTYTPSTASTQYLSASASTEPLTNTQSLNPAPYGDTRLVDPAPAQLPVSLPFDPRTLSETALMNCLNERFNAIHRMVVASLPRILASAGRSLTSTQDLPWKMGYYQYEAFLEYNRNPNNVVKVDLSNVITGDLPWAIVTINQLPQKIKDAVDSVREIMRLCPVESYSPTFKFKLKLFLTERVKKSLFVCNFARLRQSLCERLAIRTK